MKFDFDKVYEHIGYLFYALVSRDRGLSPSDHLRLIDLIENAWKPEASSDQVLYWHLTNCIHTGIRYAMDNKMSAAEAAESFRTYFLIHSLAFGTMLRNKILTSVEVITKQFPRRLPTAVVEQERQLLLEFHPTVM